MIEWLITLKLRPNVLNQKDCFCQLQEYHLIFLNKKTVNLEKLEKIKKLLRYSQK